MTWRWGTEILKTPSYSHFFHPPQAHCNARCNTHCNTHCSRIGKNRDIGRCNNRILRVEFLLWVLCHFHRKNPPPPGGFPFCVVSQDNPTWKQHQLCSKNWGCPLPPGSSLETYRSLMQKSPIKETIFLSLQVVLWKLLKKATPPGGEFLSINLTGFARLVSGRSKCSPGFLIKRDACIVIGTCDM